MIQMKIVWDKSSYMNLMGALRSKVVDIESNAGAILLEVATKIMEESKAECPYDTGALRSTAHIYNPVKTIQGTSVKMGYGGPLDKLRPKKDLYQDRYKLVSEYMLEVHEINQRHKIGKWKFLEDPVKRNAKWFYSFVGTKMKAAINAGGRRGYVR